MPGAVLQIPVGFALCTIPLHHSGLSRTAMVTFGVDVSGIGGAYASAANKICNDYDSTFGADTANEVTIGPVELTVGQDGGEHLAQVGTISNTGNSASNKMPPNNAILLHKRSARGGRRGRGRMYVPWILAEDGSNEAGALDAAVISGFTTTAATFLTALSTGALGTPMVLLHSTSDDEVNEPTPPGSPNVVTSLTVDPIVGSQRRRLGRS